MVMLYGELHGRLDVGTTCTAPPMWSTELSCLHLWCCTACCPLAGTTSLWGHITAGAFHPHLVGSKVWKNKELYWFMHKNADAGRLESRITADLAPAIVGHGQTKTGLCQGEMHLAHYFCGHCTAQSHCLFRPGPHPNNFNPMCPASRNMAAPFFRAVLAAAGMRELNDKLSQSLTLPNSTTHRLLWGQLLQHEQGYMVCPAPDSNSLQDRPVPHGFRWLTPKDEFKALYNITSDQLKDRLQPLYMIDVTPEHVYDPRVPVRVKALIPEARMVVLLRDPAARAASDWAMNWR